MTGLMASRRVWIASGGMVALLALAYWGGVRRGSEATQGEAKASPGTKTEMRLSASRAEPPAEKQRTATFRLPKELGREEQGGSHAEDPLPETSDPEPPWTPEARAARAEQEEQQIRVLMEDVAREELDAHWATESEQRIMQGLAQLPGVAVSTVRCASKRCAVEVGADSAHSASLATHALKAMTEFPRGKIRQTESDGRFSLRVVVARDGYTVWAEPEPGSRQ